MAALYNRVWALGITYIPMARVLAYLAAIVDAGSRRVRTHKMTILLEACHAVEIIAEAFAQFGLPEIVNTHQRSHFPASDLTEALPNILLMPINKIGIATLII